MMLKTQRKHSKPEDERRHCASLATARLLLVGLQVQGRIGYTRLGLCAIICCCGRWARAHTALTLITERENSAHVASWPVQSMNNVADE